MGVGSYVRGQSVQRDHGKDSPSTTRELLRERCCGWGAYCDCHPGARERDDVLDVREVAELLRMPRSTIFDYARRGVLPGHKLGRRWVFLRDELDAAVRTAPSSPHATPAPQPPGLQRQKASRATLKWYPKVVPHGPSGQQLLSLD